MSNSTSSATSLSSTSPVTVTSSPSLSSSSVVTISSSGAGQDSTTTVYPSSTNIVTSIVSASSVPPTTNVVTSVITQSADGGTNTGPVTVVITSVGSPSTTNIITAVAPTSHSTESSTSSTPQALSTTGAGSNGGSSSSSGLTTAGKTAIAVVIPVAFVALLVGLGIWFWRRRKQHKDDREQRRKELDDYGYNPNNDPTLPTVGAAAVAADGSQPQMAEDSNSGYRGWGAATMSSNRKASTTLSGGHTHGQLSDSGNSYGQGTPSPNNISNSDGHSGDPLVHHSNQRDTMTSDELGALGAAPLASANQGSGIRRGPSNASSAYSAGARSDGSDDPANFPPGGFGQAVEYGSGSGGNYGYGQHGPYGDGSYGGGAVQQDAGGMPIVRDVSARRNTRIQQGGQYQQGNSGIAQNF